ncbi:uncharacterized protein LOC135806390 [Sycon ciliatum]|uniref:uncharacterized protein LOC135806390 n=1 Tax=Sycon ciliatum TaxID=27933 RepID=UPI0020ACA768|eukprot:scpid69467/ scgid19965/ Alpha-galactosidase; Alpha-D-galactoside galactohydrolase; Melibiase
MRMLLVTLLLVGSLTRSAMSLDNGLALTPAMGYNSWYDVTCSGDMNEKIIMASADAMVSTGLAKLGYKYINLDDCWAKGRDSTGAVYADNATFPSGMKALADYVHSKGLLFGVYTDRGTNTCGGRPGSQDHETIDAKSYASWGVDYVKEDSCHAPNTHGSGYAQYGKMRDALNATGRPIYFSLCGWNEWYAPVGYSLGNSWRISRDDTNWGGIITNINVNAKLAPYAGPGGWNDPCLLLGNTSANKPRITDLQQRSQFSMWAVMASPLLISSNIRKLSTYALETYSNEEVIAVNQDKIGRQGLRLAGGDLSGEGVKQSTQTDEIPKHLHKRTFDHLPSELPAQQNIWGRQLLDGGWALVFLNNGKDDVDMTCDAACFAPTGFDASTSFTVRDLWLHKDIGTGTGSNYTVSKVPANGGSVMLKLSFLP